jgi:flagellin-like protein
MLVAMAAIYNAKRNWKRVSKIHFSWAHLIQQFRLTHARRQKKAISEIIATLLMIVIVVGLGATLFAFATGAFSSFGSNFQGLLSNSSNKIAEDVVIEQVTFANTLNPSTSGFTLYVMNAGNNPTTIQAVYLQNVTANTFTKQFASSPLPVNINPGALQNITIKGMLPDHGFVYGFTIATSLGNTVTYYAKYN